MKNFILHMLLLAPTLCFGQLTDWQLFPSNQKTFYLQQDSMFLYYNDSTEVLDGFERHLFGANYYYPDLLECKDEIDDLMYTQGYSVPDLDTLFSDSERYFDIFQGDTIPFYPTYEVGQYWLIPVENQETYDEIKITCTNQAEQEFLGYLDEVKIFEVQTFQAGMPVNSILNSIQFELSKNAGFIKFVPLDWLVNPPADIVINELVGFEKTGETFGFISSFENYFHHFQPGDVFKWKEDFFCQCYDYSETTVSWWRDSIKNVQILEDGIELTFDRTHLSYRTIIGPDPSQDTTLTVDTDLTWTYRPSDLDFAYTNIFDLEFAAANWFSAYDADDIYRMLYKTSAMLLDTTGRASYQYELFAYLQEEDCQTDLIYEDWYNIVEVTEELGMVYNYEFSGYGQFGEHIIREAELLGFQRADEIHGDIDPVTATNSQPLYNLDMILFPNPAREILNIDLLNITDFDQLQWQLFNSLGQQIKQGNIAANTFQIPVRKLEPGSYFIKIIGQEYLGLKQWIKL